MRHAVVGLLLLCGLCGCASQEPPAVPVPAALPAAFPEADYRRAAAAGRPVLRVDPVRSLVSVEVYRGGPLAVFGHDHVVASRDVNGWVDLDAGRADLYLPLARLTVDEPALRARAGLTTQPPVEAVEGTRRNMLDKVLDTGRYPYALVSVRRDPASPATLRVTVALHGRERSYVVPAQIESTAAGLQVSGRLSLRQSDFGIVPLAVLGGALQVQDGLDLHFRIEAGKG